jgi:hydroxyacylglutathione hydrolase
MYIEQLYTNCLSQAAYYVESEGEAAIIDPMRDYDKYIELAKSRNASIKYIFETHFHADFISGHIDLSKKTGAAIIYGPGAQTGYAAYNAADGEEFRLGKVSIHAIHTPGHTLESTCYLLKDEHKKDHALFTGDTLFVGDVGRPDLLDGGSLTKEDLAGMMYDSLNKKIKPLSDEVLVYPAHGPGSACGKNLGPEKSSTLGIQKGENYALQDMDKSEFIKILTEGITPPPGYFFEDAKLNKQGYEPLEEILSKSLTPLNLDEFKEKRKKGALVIDSRIPDEFELGFIPKSINLGLNGQYAIWAATLFPLDQAIILVTEEGKEHESVTRLARVGFNNIAGYLKGGFNTWKDSMERTDMVISIDPEEFELDYKFGEIAVVDVRKPSEFESSHVKGAELHSLDHLENELEGLDKNKSYYIHCAGGYRSMIAASMMKARGFHSVKNIYGGFGKIKATSVPLEASNEYKKIN